MGASGRLVASVAVSDQPEPESKKLQEKRARRLADEQKAAERQRAARRRSLVTIGLALLVGALVVGLIFFDRRGDSGGTDVGGPSSPAAAGCSPIERHEVDEQAVHVDEGTAVDYDTNPPTNGDHYEQPAEPGFFGGEAGSVPAERLVHNLEHGQLVIWYRPDAPEEVKDEIEEVTEQDPVALIAAPWEIEGSANYVLTAWGASQSCVEVSQAVIDDFRREFQGRGPENAGVPTFDG